MAEAAAALGYEYITITDHAEGLPIAGGLNEQDLRTLAEEVAIANARLRQQGLDLRVLRSIELNLNPIGQGDLAPGALNKLDLVLGAFRSGLRRTEDQTTRYLAALENPHMHVLTHPRGRIYNYRLGLTANWARVFDRAAELDKAVEIDCFPDRQDLDLELLKLARRSGVRISLGTDSHHAWQLEYVSLGPAAACLAKIPTRIAS